jgi:hypothetical protein
LHLFDGAHTDQSGVFHTGIWPSKKSQFALPKTTIDGRQVTLLKSRADQRIDLAQRMTVDFSVKSLTADWNEFLRMVVVIGGCSDPRNRCHIADSQASGVTDWFGASISGEAHVRNQPLGDFHPMNIS